MTMLNAVRALPFRMLGLLALCATLGGCSPTPTAGHAEGQTARAVAQATDSLPHEAHDTLALIRRGGPFPYAKDGTVFQNREGRLPARARGYYREYTVPTPGARDRGARRIISGGEPPEVYYYTPDHYRSFHRLDRLP